MAMTKSFRIIHMPLIYAQNGRMRSEVTFCCSQGHQRCDLSNLARGAEEVVVVFFFFAIKENLRNVIISGEGKHDRTRAVGRGILLHGGGL